MAESWTGFGNQLDPDAVDQYADPDTEFVNV
jgi:hypothetical protein